MHISTVLPPESPFAHVETTAELEVRWEQFTEPEILLADGERTHDQATAVLDRYANEFKIRAAELLDERCAGPGYDGQPCGHPAPRMNGYLKVCNYHHAVAGGPR
ncbi:MAG: hypothetical protein L0H93_02485 [Nocardioides sp.]|nr:hypothetical protein [Nocardioides sp.]